MAEQPLTRRQFVGRGTATAAVAAGIASSASAEAQPAQDQPPAGPLAKGMKIGFHTDAFNSAYFPQPVVAATSPTFGQISASNQANYARRGQIGIKLIF